MPYSLGQIDQTIQKIINQWPEYDVWADGGSSDTPSLKYQQLYKLFHEVYTDKQIARFRGLWHAWKIEGKQENEELIKEMLEYV